MAYHKLDGKLDIANSDGGYDPHEHTEHFRYLSDQNKPIRRVLYLSLANVVLLVIQLTILAAHIITNSTPTSVGHVEETYGFDTKYMTLSHDYDWLWQHRAIERAGAIAIETDDTGEVVEYGVISMFHSLHCVASLRRALQTAHEGGYVAFDQNQDPHWPHCLHYLHQMITCRADDQIEKQELWNFTTPFISGSEDVRKCGDSKRLYDLFEQKG